MVSLREVEYVGRPSMLVSGATAAVNARAAQGSGRPPVHFPTHVQSVILCSHGQHLSEEKFPQFFF